MNKHIKYLFFLLMTLFLANNIQAQLASDAPAPAIEKPAQPSMQKKADSAKLALAATPVLLLPSAAMGTDTIFARLAKLPAAKPKQTKASQTFPVSSKAVANKH